MVMRIFEHNWKKQYPGCNFAIFYDIDIGSSVFFQYFLFRHFFENKG